MSRFIKLRKGFNINLAGKAKKTIRTVDQPETFAIKPTDFLGSEQFKVVAEPGQTVKAGTPILVDKKREDIKFVAPVSGEIAEVVRGAKRKMLEVRVLADKSISYESFKKYSATDLEGLSKEDAAQQMKEGGVWLNIIQRPYGIIADSADSPKSIFISGFDSHPLAPDYGILFEGEKEYFQAGVNVLKKFTEGSVHLNLDAKSETPEVFKDISGVTTNQFAGPHPAGCVGVQIHHLDPVNKGDVVWTVNPYGVIQIGKFFLEGKYDASKTIAVVGSEIKEPAYVKTYIGASIKKFVEGNLNSDHVRYVSGNVLTGEPINADGYLGFYDHMITVIPEGDEYELFGWILPTTEKLSFQRAFGLLSFLNPNKEYTLNTNLRGEPRTFVQTGVFEKLVPMDVLPTHLVKSILAEDYDDMEALGIYEVIEEDLALCEFADVSKHNIQEIVRQGINLIKNG